MRARLDEISHYSAHVCTQNVVCDMSDRPLLRAGRKLRKMGTIGSANDWDRVCDEPASSTLLYLIAMIVMIRIIAQNCAELGMSHNIHRNMISFNSLNLYLSKSRYLPPCFTQELI